MWLISKEDDDILFTTAALSKVNFKMTDVDIQAALTQADYISQKRSFKGVKGLNLWIPSMHKDTKNLAKNGWSVWNGDGLNIYFPEGPKGE